MADVIDTLVGIAPGSALDAIRARRPEARTHAEASYRALFAPADPAGITLAERFAVACFVTGLHHENETGAFYAARLAEAHAPAALPAAIAHAVAAAHSHGPFGHYPAGPLSAEDTEGKSWQPDTDLTIRLGPKLAAAFAHVHMLVFHPRDAAPESLQALLDAGWGTTDIVTLSQIVAFLSFQLRVVSGFRTLAATA